MSLKIFTLMIKTFVCVFPSLFITEFLIWIMKIMFKHKGFSFFFLWKKKEFSYSVHRNMFKMLKHKDFNLFFIFISRFQVGCFIQETRGRQPCCARSMLFSMWTKLCPFVFFPTLTLHDHLLYDEFSTGNLCSFLCVSFIGEFSLHTCLIMDEWRSD